jgi:hypothetical protein
MCLSDVDDDDAALFAVGGRWRYGRFTLTTRTLEGHLRPALLLAPLLLLFASQDLFDDPGIQHRGPPFGFVTGYEIALVLL